MQVGVKMVQKRNLSEAKVVTAAAKLVDEQGGDALSFSRVAAELAVKPQALYAYFSSKETLKVAVIVHFLDGITAAISQALIGISGERALEEYGHMLRRLLLAQPEQARLAFGGINYRHQEVAIHHLQQLIDILEALIQPYTSTTTMTRHRARLFRAMVFGFVQNELWGLFQYGEILADESFEYGLQRLINQLTTIEK